MRVLLTFLLSMELKCISIYRLLSYPCLAIISGCDDLIINLVEMFGHLGWNYRLEPIDHVRIHRDWSIEEKINFL